MKLPKIEFKPKSLLSFLTATSFVGWLFGIWFKGINEPIGIEIIGLSRLVFFICFPIWLIFIYLTLRNRF
jgi:hypothetical protein